MNQIAESTAKKQASQYFKPAGHLNYTYAPGVILPLRNGKILALDGFQSTDRTEKERFFQAEDGHCYGEAHGMAELFDPATGETKVLTKMPFSFINDSDRDRRQMQAIELKDGRIFMVGWFGENRPESPSSNKPRTPMDNKLPFFSNIDPHFHYQLRGVAPGTEPHLFGLLYDWHHNTFEIVNTTDKLLPRYMVTMNLLPDGRVLIIGGAVSTDMYNSWRQLPETRVLVFDPTTRKLSVVGNLQYARYGHQTIPINATQFMMFGGWGQSSTAAQADKDLQAKQEAEALSGHDGNAYYDAISGHPSRTKDVEVFDLKTGHSKVVGHTLTGRYDFSALLLPNQKVLINGGYQGQKMGYRASELYDLKTGNCILVGEKRSPEDIKALGKNPPVRFFGESEQSRAILNNDLVQIATFSAGHAYKWNSLDSEDALKAQHTPYLLLMLRDLHHIVKTPSERVFIMGGVTSFDKKADLIEEFVYPTEHQQKGE